MLVSFLASGTVSPHILFFANHSSVKQLILQQKEGLKKSGEWNIVNQLLYFELSFQSLQFFPSYFLSSPDPTPNCTTVPNPLSAPQYISVSLSLTSLPDITLYNL